MNKLAMRPAETRWGKAIDWLIAETGISLGDLSRAIGKERSQIYNWRFKGKRGPTIDNVAAILNAMGCSWVDWANAMEAVDATDTKAQELAIGGPNMNSRTLKVVTRKHPPAKTSPKPE